MVKQNDKVRIDGKTLTVNSIWCQGRHKVYSMSDDSLILDLDKRVESGNAELLKTSTFTDSGVKPKPFNLPLEEENDD